MQKQIIPAIIAKSQEEMEERINKVKGHFEILQLDVMDGKFVPNNSLNFDFKLPEASCRYEAHLMVENPEEWINKYGERADNIIAHFESCKEPKKIIELIKSKGKRASFAINPETSLEKIKPYLKRLDHILIMTVNPGFYGSKFVPEALEKVRELKKIWKKDIEVDGSINPETISLADEAGANLFVCGSYLQKSEDIKEAISSLKKQFSDYGKLQ